MHALPLQPCGSFPSVTKLDTWGFTGRSMCIVGATPGLSFFSLAQVSVSALHSAGVTVQDSVAVALC